MEIYFTDLTKDAQKRLLEEAGIKDPSDANWDAFPIGDVGWDGPQKGADEE